MRTAASTVGAVKRRVTPSTRSKLGHWQNRSASAEVWARSVTVCGPSKTSGLAFARAASASSTPARIARRDCSGESDTPLVQPVAFFVSTKVACGKSGRFSAMNTSSPLAFSTAYTVPDSVERPMPAVAMLHDGLLDGLFQAAADSTEQAIIHALWRATAVTGRDGNHRASLADVLPASTLFSNHA